MTGAGLAAAAADGERQGPAAALPPPPGPALARERLWCAACPWVLLLPAAVPSEQAVRREESRARARPALAGPLMPAAVTAPDKGACPGRGGRRGVRCCPRGASAEPRRWVSRGRVRRSSVNLVPEPASGERTGWKQAHRHAAARLAAESRVQGEAGAGACVLVLVLVLVLVRVHLVTCRMYFPKVREPLGWWWGRRLLHSRPLSPPSEGGYRHHRGGASHSDPSPGM